MKTVPCIKSLLFAKPILKCAKVEVAKWTPVFWYKKKDSHQGIKFAHGPVFPKIMEIVICYEAK